MLPRTCFSRFRSVALITLTPALVLVGCGSVPQSSSVTSSTAARQPASKTASSTHPTLPPAGSGRGGYYLDDGPGDAPPEGLLDTPDAEPQVEPYSIRGNKPYVVFGKTYTPITDERPFKQTGVGSWYGKKFHGQKTSSGEPYDMYKMTAAHPTLPIPSYARVTNLLTGKQVIVRVNDRGPFHSGRIIDLSYTAALKLGYLGKGSSQLEVERLLPEEIARIASARKEQQVLTAQQVPTPEVLSAAAAVQSVNANEANVPSIAQPAVSQAEPVVLSTAPASSLPGFYLQLGAYTQAANAEAARTRLAQSAGAMLAPLDVVGQGAVYRLYSGPFASKAEAAAAAAQLRDRGTFKPMIVQR
ncbi:MAG TPA: septal ring lytic transglycosylase RlpA family protein [Noviherbaspirillum sp.]|nr:septal ring lytic transglycosylase RlpA family protein [Noviherbaspirillum sp.]